MIDEILRKYGYDLDDAIDYNHQIFEGIDESKKSQFVAVLIGKGLMKKPKMVS